MPLSAEEIAELKESFLYNDRNGDGRLEFSEFRAMLRDLASGVSEAEARIGFDIGSAMCQ